MPDAPIATRAGKRIFLTDAFVQQGTRFALIAFGDGAVLEAPGEVGAIRIGGEDGFVDSEGLASARYDAEGGSAYLLRPDGYVAARFRHPTRASLEAALARASGLN
jgi:3-(3-hydroxy-phenyl)propionate hydroxylase